MKKLSYLLAVLTQLVLLIACSEEVLEPNTPGNGTGTDTPYVIPGRPITISADMENQGAGNTRTALASDGLSVVWSEGDAFSLMTKEGEELVEPEWDLEATVDKASSGLGIKVNYTGKAYIKYAGIKILDKNLNDITDKFTSTGQDKSNSYYVGVYREGKSSSKIYCYSSPNIQIEALINGSYIPLIQSSSSSNDLPVYVKLKGVQYSQNGNSWTNLDPASLNGYGDKNSVTYIWNYTTSVKSNSRFGVDVDSNAPNRTTASFSGDLIVENATHYAVYPYNESNAIVDDKITFTLPAEQQYVANSFGNGANPAVGILEGTEDNYHISFKNVCGVLQLQLTGDDYVTSIDLEDNYASSSLNGTASVEVSKENDVYNVGAAQVSGGTNKITLNIDGYVQLKEEEPTTFYFVVPAGAFKTGFRVTVNTFYGSKSVSTNRNNMICQNDIKVMDVLSLKNRNLVIPEFNVENSYVQTFMATNNATFSSATGNYNTLDKFGGSDHDLPNTKTISWTSSGKSYIQMSTDADYQNIVLETETDDNTFTLRNMVPGNTYYYKVTDTNGSLLTAGAFKTTGQLRMIALDHGFNIRDLGGWTGWNDNAVRYEQIYRGGSLGGGINYNGVLSSSYVGVNEIDKDDKDELARLGILAQLDLRAVYRSGMYDKSNETSYHSYSSCDRILGDHTDFNNTQTDYGAYVQDATLISDVAWVIYELQRGKPVYFNCRQGADRTGALGFLIECLLGCYNYYGQGGGNQTAMDYELTGYSTASRSDNVGTPAHRPAKTAYSDTGKFFYKLINNINGCGGAKSTMMEKGYYYLNQFARTSQSCYTNNSHKVYGSSKTNVISKTTNNKIAINKSDLDWFINFMLGITDREGNVIGNKQKYEGPTWASDGYDLKTTGETNTNYVIYAQ